MAIAVKSIEPPITQLLRMIFYSSLNNTLLWHRIIIEPSLNCDYIMCVLIWRTGVGCKPCTCQSFISSWDGLHARWRFWWSKEWFWNGMFQLSFCQRTDDSLKRNGRYVDMFPCTVLQMIKIDKSSEPDATAAILKLKQKEQAS